MPRSEREAKPADQGQPRLATAQGPKSFLPFFFKKAGLPSWPFEQCIVPTLASTACFAFIIAGGLLAQLLPLQWVGNWADHVVRNQAHFVERFFPFDAVWYQRIASDLYAWNPLQPAVKQDVTFFPLWPVVLRLIMALGVEHQAAQWITVGVAAVFGFASICAFHFLALKTLPRQSAATATWFFAMWPGASFLLLSYPTGLMNLLVVMALLSTMRRRFWAAGGCAGLLTAAGPLGLGTAMAVWLCAAVDLSAALRPAPERTLGGLARALAYLAGLGVLATSGLTGFMLWQYIKFADAFAFIKAQGAWAAPLPWLARIPRAIMQLLIVPDFGLAISYAVHALHARSLVGLQAELEKGVHHATLGLALLMLLACARAAPRPVVLQGAFTLALFIWFHSTSRPGNSALRLTYCVMSTFWGFAWVVRGRPRLAAWAIGVSAAMLCCDAFLSAAGYHVV
jgi:hypothetical protein